MSKNKRKPTHEEAALKAMCIVAINEQVTAQELCDELLRQHEALKTYLIVKKNGDKNA